MGHGQSDVSCTYPQSMPRLSYLGAHPSSSSTVGLVVESTPSTWSHGVGLMVDSTPSTWTQLSDQVCIRGQVWTKKVYHLFCFYSFFLLCSVFFFPTNWHTRWVGKYFCKGYIVGTSRCYSGVVACVESRFMVIGSTSPLHSLPLEEPQTSKITTKVQLFASQNFENVEISLL